MRTKSGVAVMILAAGLLSSCSRGGADGQSAASGEWAMERSSVAERQLRPVEGVTAERGPIVKHIDASGLVRGASEATIISEAQGVIESVSLQLGQFVSEGDLLVQVESTIARLNLDEARQVYESTRLDLEATQRRFDGGSASQADLTRARSAANGARARLEVAEKSLRDQSIRAPISGFIASQGDNMSRGNSLSRGTTVARIVDLSSLEVEIGVGERELRFVATGAPVSVHVPGCGEQRYEARVRSIAAGSSARTGSFSVIVGWENSCDRVRSGMSASVRVTAQDADPRIIVPGVSVRSDADGTFVFIPESSADGATAVRRAVVVGERLGERVQILEGLEEGDVVLTTGVTTLRSGDPVEVTIIGTSGEIL